MYIDDDIGILEGPLRLLRLHQLWPHPGEKISDFRPIVRLTMAICFFSMTLCFACNNMWFMYNYPHTIIVDDLIEDLIVLTVYTTLFCKIYFMVVHMSELNEFMHDLHDYAVFGKPPGIDEVNTRANYFAYIFYVYGWSGNTMYTLSGLLDKGKCEHQDVHNSRTCGFPLPLRYPWSVEPAVNFYLTWFVQYLSLTTFLLCGIIIDSYLFSTIEIYNTKIVHLKENIVKLGMNPERTRHGIRYCVEYHVKIIKMCRTLNVCWGRLMLYHQGLVSITESLIGIQFLLSWDFKCILHGLAWMISLALPCYAGQRLQNESSEIPMAIFSSHWYDLDIQTQKDLVYMLMCANNALDLDRDGYGPVNLSIVASMIHNIYSVLTLLYGTMTGV